MAKKTNPKNIATLSSLVNVKKISDNPEITIDKDLNCLNYSYLVTATDFNNTDEYRNYKIKLKTITDYIIEQDASFYSQFLGMFNHYVKSLKGDNFIIVKRIHPNDDSSNILLSYEYVIEPELSRIERAEYKQYVEIGEDGFVYDDTIQQNNNYPYEIAYMNKLTPGIITAEVLEEYMETTIERIIGVPNTYGQQTPIIDSIKEFVDWFWGYVRDNEEYGSLSYLIRTIEKKDEHIRQLAFAYTAEERDKLLTNINNTFNDLDFEYSCEEHRFLTGIKQINGKIVEVTDGEGGLNIEVDQNNNTINVSGTQYTLSMIDGKLGLHPYTPISLSGISSPRTFEYNSGEHSITLSATPSKNCTVTNRWEDDSPGTTPYNGGSPISATVSVYGNSTSSYTLTVKETDPQAATATGIIEVKYDQFKVGVFASPSEINNINISENDKNQPIIPNTYGGVFKVSTSLPSSFGSFIVTGAESYIYFLLPKDWVIGGRGFKWMGTEGLPETPGSANTNQITLYNNNINYTLYRSGIMYPVGTTINLKYTT